MKTLTPISRFDDVQTFEHSDPYPGPTSIEVPVQQLLNRTEFLTGRLRDGWEGELVLGTDFVGTAPSTSTITMSTDQRRYLKRNTPIRVLDATGVEYSDVGNKLSGYEGITGLSDVVLDEMGRLYFEITGGPIFSCDIYNHVDVGAGDLVGHALYTGAGNATVLPDNDSGLGGEITIDATGTQSGCYVGFYKWGMVSACTDTLLTLRGAPISTTALVIRGLWHGAPRRGWQFDLVMPGEFAKVASPLVLKEFGLTAFRWRGPPGRVCGFAARLAAHGGGTDPTINVHVGGTDVSSASLTLAAADTWVQSAITVDPENCRIADDTTAIEVRTTQGNAAGGDEDLTVSVFGCYE